MNRPVRVTIVQFDCDADDPLENLEVLKHHIREHRDSDLIVFPELALHGHEITHEHTRQVRAAFRAVSPDDIEELDRHIREVGARVVYGKLIEREGKLLNLATYTDGTRRTSYAKTHVHWSEPFEPGNEFPIADTPIGPLGMLICFDAAFPEVPRLLALKGAKIIVNISAIPERFPLKYVHRRLVACSIENQVFTVFANRTGPGFKGGSAVVDPRGEILGTAGEQQEALTIEMDLGEVDSWRQEEPLIPNRRPYLYASLAR